MRIYLYILLTVLSYFGITNLYSQSKFFTRTGKTTFYSKAPLEDIKAVNNQVSCLYDIEANRIVANVLIKAFEFEKALMQKHFNENYLESDKFPKASFKGKIINPEKIELNSNWTKEIDYEGDLTIHGVTKKIKNQAQITMKNNTLTINSVFYVNLKDYEIKIPSTVINNVAEKVQVEINLILTEFKN